MASFSMKITLLSLLVAFSNSLMARAADPDITSDFLVPANINASALDGSFFTFTGLRGVFGFAVPKFTITKAAKAEFPALDGQSVSLAVLQYPASSVNPPHVHPRSAELLFVLKGSLEGLVHFQYNSDPSSAAIAISAFGSANAGTASLPATLFATNVDNTILAKSFKTDVATIQKIKSGLAS